MANAKHLLLEYDCGEPLNRLYIGDPFRTRQIVENLLSNALKFTQEGSITLRAALENGQLHISISDTSCGISEEEHKDKKVSDWDWLLQKNLLYCSKEISG